jgi:hemophore-related protein
MLIELIDIAMHFTLLGCNASPLRLQRNSRPVFALRGVGNLEIGRGRQVTRCREERSIMNINGFSAPRRIHGVGAACLIGAGLAAATIAAPTASAAPDPCSADAVAATVSSVTGSAQQYLGSHPGANQVVTAAYGQPQPQAEADLRGYFTANPQEYYELRAILVPLGDKQRQCNVQVLPPQLASAYDRFMAG